MTTSKLSYHFQLLGGEEANIAAASEAKWIKVIDPPNDNPFPGKQIIGRTYVDDGEANAMVALGTLGGELWYAKWRDFYKSRPYVTLWEGPNEPQPIHDAAFRKQLVDFTLRWAQLMHANNMKILALCLSVGCPDIPEFPDFLPLIGHVDAIANHEYSAPAMWDGQSWYCLRYRRFFEIIRAAGKVVPPWFITEAGIDGGVLDPPRTKTGWKTFTTPAGYLAQLAWYDAELRKDPEIVAATVFTSRPNADWQDFNVDPDISRRIAAHLAATQDNPPTDTLATRLRLAAEANDVLQVNPTAALCKAGAARNLWPTSNEFSVVFGGSTYIAQRFRDPRSNAVTVLYCLLGQWDVVREINY